MCLDFSCVKLNLRPCFTFVSDGLIILSLCFCARGDPPFVCFVFLVSYVVLARTARKAATVSWIGWGRSTISSWRSGSRTVRASRRAASRSWSRAASAPRRSNSFSFLFFSLLFFFFYPLLYLSNGLIDEQQRGRRGEEDRRK